jgi:hypothetical protein
MAITASGRFARILLLDPVDARQLKRQGGPSLGSGEAACR